MRTVGVALTLLIRVLVIGEVEAPTFGLADEKLLEEADGEERGATGAETELLGSNLTAWGRPCIGDFFLARSSDGAALAFDGASEAGGFFIHFEEEGDRK